MTALVPRATVREMVASYEAAVLAIRQCFGQLDSSLNRLQERFRVQSFRDDHNRAFDFDENNANRLIRNLTKDCWRDIFSQMNLEKFVSIADMAKLEKERLKGELPPITEEAVMSLMNSFLAQLPDLLDAQIAEVFDWLRPHPKRNRLKTNNPWKVGEKVIVEHAVRRDPWDKSFGVSYWGDMSVRLIALESVASGIAGLPRSDSHKSELERAIKLNPEGETALFRYRACANGNLHLWFKNTLVPAEMNRRAGGRGLKEAS